MRLPPDPIRCRQRAAADAARFPESFRARRALLEADHDPARLREPPSADRDVPPPARYTCGACPASRRTGRPRRPDIPPPRRPDIPPRTDRIFHPLSAGDAPHGRPLSTQGQAQKKRDGSPLSTQRQAQKKTGRQPTLYAEAGTKKNGTAAHTRPRKGNRIS